jgi:hypothetical protein
LELELIRGIWGEPDGKDSMRGAQAVELDAVMSRSAVHDQVCRPYHDGRRTSLESISPEAVLEDFKVNITIFF